MPNTKKIDVEFTEIDEFHGFEVKPLTETGRYACEKIKGVKMGKYHIPRYWLDNHVESYSYYGCMHSIKFREFLPKENH